MLTLCRTVPVTASRDGVRSTRAAEGPWQSEEGLRLSTATVLGYALRWQGNKSDISWCFCVPVYKAVDFNNFRGNLCNWASDMSKSVSEAK